MTAPDEAGAGAEGGWHLAGDHGAIDPDQALRDMAAIVAPGSAMQAR